ncbi:TPA: sporulation protein Cse60 [Streptococcus suis]
MIKVEVFLSQYFGDIEKEVNEFLTENKVKFVDIKYNSAIAVDGYNNVVQQYSALLVYEEAENDTEV